MGESRARTGFGQVDLQIDQEAGDAFGELDWDIPSSSEPAPAVPASTTHTTSSKQTIRRDDAEMEAIVDSTRIVSNAALAPLLEEEREKTPPPSSRHSGQHGAPSASRVEAKHDKNDRVAAMREAYARGDAEGALAIANAMESATVPPPPDDKIRRDYFDSTVALEIGGEVELDLEVDVEDPVHAKDLTRIAPSGRSIPPAPVLSSLTERQGIPRILLGPAEISKLPIDHRAGFLLGFIDGMQTMEEILDVCAMPANEALDLIRALVDMGVIEIE